MVLRIYSYYVKYNSIIVADVIRACILAILEKGKRFVIFPQPYSVLRRYLS